MKIIAEVDASWCFLSFCFANYNSLPIPILLLDLFYPDVTSLLISWRHIHIRKSRRRLLKHQRPLLVSTSMIISFKKDTSHSVMKLEHPLFHLTERLWIHYFGQCHKYTDGLPLKIMQYLLWKGSTSRKLAIVSPSERWRMNHNHLMLH